MNNIHIFYHVGQIGMWEFIYMDQIHKMYLSGLLQNANTIHIGINGDLELPQVPKNANLVRFPNTGEENTTMSLIKTFCESNPDSQVMYIHTKGVKHNNRYCESWRRFMDYFTIIKWKENLEYLKEYDCVGTNWQTYSHLGDHPHFSGNCWWANASHINGLNHNYLTSPNRYDREFWIGSSYFEKKSKVKDIFHTGLNNYEKARHYYEVYPEDNYVTPPL